MAILNEAIVRQQINSIIATNYRKEISGDDANMVLNLIVDYLLQLFSQDPAFKGAWNASTNSPTLTTTPSAANDFYTVTVAGTQSITGSSVAFTVGDTVRSNGSAWVRIPYSDLALQKATINESGIASLNDILSESSNSQVIGQFADEAGNMVAKILSNGDWEFLNILLKNININEFLNLTNLGGINSIGYTIEETGAYLLAVRDEAGYIIAAINLDSTSSTVNQLNAEDFLKPDDVGVEFSTTELYSYIVVDEDGYISYGINNDGSPITSGVSAIQKTNAFLPADIIHIPSYGQSLSVGVGNTPITTSQPYNSLMFVGGVRTWYGVSGALISGTTKYDSLVPLVESIGETPVSGFAEGLVQRIQAENGISYDEHEFIILGSAPGWGGAQIEGLDKPGTFYTQFLTDIQYGILRANELGKTYNVPAVIWTQGETDTFNNMSTATYVGLLKQLIIDLNADIKAITGQTNDVHLVMYQLGSYGHQNPNDYPNIALAHAQVAEEVEIAHCATPTYHLDYSDNVHLTAISSKWLGAYYALAFKKAVVDEEVFKPFAIKSWIVQKNIVEARFQVPVGNMVFDTDWVTDPGNYGFSVTNSAGVLQTITSVSIVRADTVRIVLSADIPSGGSRLRYGINATSTSGRMTGARGNLRDSQGEYITFDINGTVRPMHNWCLVFDKIIN